MENTNYFILSRAIHVIGVVLWIGGVAFVTTVLIPSLKKLVGSDARLEMFEQLEGRFALQARIVILVTGITGFYMVYFIDAWERYHYLQYWWMHLMTFIWLVFTIVLFVLEPLVLHRWFHEKATEDSDSAFAWLHRMHKVLLSLSVLAIIGAVVGSHGYVF